MPYSEDEICPQCDGCPDCCTCYSEDDYSEEFEDNSDDHMEE